MSNIIKISTQYAQCLYEFINTGDPAVNYSQIITIFVFTFHIILTKQCDWLAVRSASARNSQLNGRLAL